MSVAAKESAKTGAGSKVIYPGGRKLDDGIAIQVREVKAPIEGRLDYTVVKTGGIVLLEISPGKVVEAKLGPVVKMPGFRPGKVPANLVRKMHGLKLERSAFEPNDEALCMIEGKAMFEKDLRDAGGCFELADVRSLLGNISRQAVDQRVQNGSLIAVTGDGNRRVYPVFQFHNGHLLPGLTEVLAALPKTSEWALVNFFVNPDDLDERTPVEMLRQNDIDAALAAARDFADSGV